MERKKKSFFVMNPAQSGEIIQIYAILQRNG
jgi:hypothetical protein